jgi:hypothetical protein
MIQVMEAQFGSLPKLLKYLFHYLFNIYSKELKREKGVELNYLFQK